MSYEPIPERNYFDSDRIVTLMRLLTFSAQRFTGFSLSLSSDTPLSEDAIARLAELLKESSYVTTIELKDWTLLENSIFIIFKAIAESSYKVDNEENRTFKCLRLSNVEVRPSPKPPSAKRRHIEPSASDTTSPPNLDGLCLLLTSDYPLLSLELNNFNLSPETLHQLAEALQRNKSLTSFSCIWEEPATLPIDAGPLLEALAGKALIQLTWTYQEESIGGLSSLYSHIRNSTTLTSLTIHGWKSSEFESFIIHTDDGESDDSFGNAVQDSFEIELLSALGENHSIMTCNITGFSTAATIELDLIITRNQQKERDRVSVMEMVAAREKPLESSFQEFNYDDYRTDEVIPAATGWTSTSSE